MSRKYSNCIFKKVFEAYINNKSIIASNEEAYRTLLMNFNVFVAYSILNIMMHKIIFRTNLRVSDLILNMDIFIHPSINLSAYQCISSPYQLINQSIYKSIMLQPVIEEIS